MTTETITELLTISLAPVRRRYRAWRLRAELRRIRMHKAYIVREQENNRHALRMLDVREAIASSDLRNL